MGVKMLLSSTDLFQEWRVANRVATTAERQMFNASIRALDGKGEPPSQAEGQRVRSLRATADDLFQLAMAQLGEQAVLARSGSSAAAVPADSNRPT
jgi:hypothetical protein